MQLKDKQLGKPGITFRDTKANISALTAEAGMTAFATDTGEFGFYNGSEWVWGDSLGGSGTVPKLDDCQPPDDNTDLDVSTTAHGLCPKLPGQEDYFLNGLGAWVQMMSKLYSVCDGRLTLQSNTPVPTSEILDGTTLYFTPFRGDLIGLYDGSKWNVHQFTQASLSLACVNKVYSTTAGSAIITMADTSDLAVGMRVAYGNNGFITKILSSTQVEMDMQSSVTATDYSSYFRFNSGVHDVFVYEDNGAFKIALMPWGNNSSRTYYTATKLNGIWINSVNSGMRYVGSVYLTESPVSGGTNKTNDGYKLRHLWNYYNQVPRKLLFTEVIASTTVSAWAWRNFRGDPNYKVEAVIGFQELCELDLTATVSVANHSSNSYRVAVGISLDGGTPIVYSGKYVATTSNTVTHDPYANLRLTPENNVIGLVKMYMMEYTGSNDVKIYSENGSGYYYNDNLMYGKVMA